MIAAVLAAAIQVTTITTAPPPAAGRQPEVAPPGGTVRVCTFEQRTGQIGRKKVCRDVPRQTQQNQETREFMRDHQRYTPEPAG